MYIWTAAVYQQLYLWQYETVPEKQILCQLCSPYIVSSCCSSCAHFTSEGAIVPAVLTLYLKCCSVGCANLKSESTAASTALTLHMKQLLCQLCSTYTWSSCCASCAHLTSEAAVVPAVLALHLKQLLCSPNIGGSCCVIWAHQRIFISDIRVSPPLRCP